MPRSAKRRSRRDFLIGAGKAGAALALATGPFVIVPGRARAAERIVAIGYGGSFGEFVKEAWIKPFTAESGIEVELVTSPDLARVKAQVVSKNVEWDVFDGSGSMIAAGSKEGLWEPLDTSVIDASRFIAPVGEDRMPVFVYSGGIAWDPARNKAPPKDFAQLWDVKKYPGRRALRTRASETLELALLADGVEPGRLYPLDIDRAFKALERLKPQVKKWFDQTTQMISLVQTNEADYVYAYANRVKAATDAGISIEFSFDQTVNVNDYFAVVRGSPRKKAAMRYLEFVTRPDRQAAMVEKMALVPVTKGAIERVSAEARKSVPNLSNPRSVFLDDNFWADRFVEVDKRFKEWVLT
jgi:putative spermidine/putrescine transport system substrate-binding protein